MTLFMPLLVMRKTFGSPLVVEPANTTRIAKNGKYSQNKMPLCMNPGPMGFAVEAIKFLLRPGGEVLWNTTRKQNNSEIIPILTATWK